MSLNIYKIGARVHDVIKYTSFLEKELKNSQLEVVQLTLPKFLTTDEVGTIDDTKLQEIKEVFQRQNIDIKVLSCYINPLAEDYEAQQQLFIRYIDYAKKIGVKIVGTETGTVVANYYDYFEKNHTEEIFCRLIRFMTPLIEYASSQGILVGIETVKYFPVCNVDTFDKFLRAFEEGAICSIFDPTNLLYIGNYEKQCEIFEKFVSIHAKHIKVVHLKDFIIENNQLKECALFEGMLNVDHVIKLLKKYNVEADIVIELATSLENYKETRKKIKEMIQRG